MFHHLVHHYHYFENPNLSNHLWNRFHHHQRRYFLFHWQIHHDNDQSWSKSNHQGHLEHFVWIDLCKPHHFRIELSLNPISYSFWTHLHNDFPSLKGLQILILNRFAINLHKIGHQDLSIFHFLIFGYSSIIHHKLLRFSIGIFHDHFDDCLWNDLNKRSHQDIVHSLNLLSDHLWIFLRIFCYYCHDHSVKINKNDINNNFMKIKHRGPDNSQLLQITDYLVFGFLGWLSKDGIQ